jgi:hypothetical protein
MNIALWIGQVVVGLFVAGSGFGKILLIDSALYAQAPRAVEWFAALSQPLIVFIGVIEVLGGIGLILPAMTAVRPKLTPLSAAGLAALMVLAAGFHITRGESSLVAPNVVLGSACAFICVSRWNANPIEPASINTRKVLQALAVLAAIAIFTFTPTWYSMTHVQF